MPKSHYKDGTPKRPGYTKSGKKRAPPSAAQKAAQDRFRAARGGRGKGGTVSLARSEDTTTPQAPSALLVRGASLKIDKEVIATTSMRDALAMAMGLLIALRNAAVGALGRRDDQQRLALKWVDAPGAQTLGSHLKGVNLDTEINFFEDLLGAVPSAAEALGFAGAEWASAWDTITRDARLDPIGPIGDSLTGGGLVVPARGTITTRFSVDHPALDVACAVGTPLRCPEDVVVQSIDRNPGLGLHVVMASRHPDGSWPAPLSTSGKSTLVKMHDGMRYHTFAHLSTVPTDVRPGDRFDAGRVFGYSGGAVGAPTSGSSTGPHYHWRVGIALEDLGHVKTVPMDPLDLISEDAITGRGPGRPPAPSWTVVDKGKTKDVAGKSVVVHGDVIIGGSGDIVSKGAGIGDIGLDLGLSRKIGDAGKGDDAFAKVNQGGSIGGGIGKGLGAVVGGIYGGPGGSKIGALVGGKAGSLTGSTIGKLMGREAQK